MPLNNNWPAVGDRPTQEPITEEGQALVTSLLEQNLTLGLFKKD